MHEFLVFRLYGPLAAWGEPAVGEYRPSHSHPGKSAIVGLLAAALGIRRDDEPRQAALNAGYGMAVLLRAAGLLLRDYHTAQVPSQRRGVSLHTRRDELTFGHREDLNTILTARDYRCDGLWDVALWARPEAPHPLAALAEALRQPRFTLYLGRKSCPLAWPLNPQQVAAPSATDAISNAKFPEEQRLNGVKDAGRTAAQRLYWEEDLPAGPAPQQTVIRRDLPASRGRWQFTERSELGAVLGEE